MPRTLRAASCVRSVLGPGSSEQHVWISDDLLNTAFRNFTHRHRRYGSNVPGPLEARRRSTKRKNTYLAHHDFGGAPIDPALVFGTASQREWWQKSPAPVKVPQRLLPDWLFGSHKSSVAKVSEAVDDELSSNHIQQARLKTTYTQELQKCTKLKSMRALVKTLDLNFRANPRFPELAFRRLLQLYWAKPRSFNSALSEFLADPFFNPPGSQNHMILLEESAGKTITRKSWDIFILPALQTAIRLGLIEGDSLKRIILDLPQAMTKCGLTAKLEDGLPISEWHRIVTSIDECKVMSVADLGESFREEWLARLSDVKPSEKILMLQRRLRQSIKPTSIETFVAALLLRFDGKSSKGVDFTTQFTDLINHLPRVQHGSAIVRMSQALVISKLSGQATQAELETWYQLLTNLNHTKPGSFEIDRKAWNDVLKQNASLTPLQNLLTMAWTIISLSRDKLATTQLLDHLEFAQSLKIIAHENGTEAPQHILSQIILCLESLPLPAKGPIQHELSGFLQANLVTLFDIEDYDKALLKYANHDLRVFDNDQFFNWTKENSPDTIEKIAESVNSDISGFSKLSQMLIMNDKRRVKLVRRILEHNLPMKIALSSWKDAKTKYKMLEPMRNRLDSGEVVALVHDLAVAAAISPALQPRAAFRQVYWFYLYLHRYGAPIQRSMARALWHAGVARYGERGCPAAQMKFCLKIVGQVEGPKAARLLLSSAKYRHARSVNMTRLVMAANTTSSSTSSSRSETARPGRNKERQSG